MLRKNPSMFLLVCTAVAFFTLGRAPGAVNLRRSDLDMMPIAGGDPSSGLAQSNA